MNPMMFLCDPQRNTACNKALCFEHGGPCGLTDDPAFALRDLFGRPAKAVTQEDAEKERSNDRHRNS